MGTNRLTHALGGPASPGPYTPNNAIQSNISIPPTGPGVFMFDAANGQYYISDPTGTLWLDATDQAPAIIMANVGTRSLARAQKTIVFYDTSNGPVSVLLPVSPILGDQVLFERSGAISPLDVGVQLPNTLDLITTASQTLWGEASPGILTKATADFELTFDGQGWI